MSSEATLVNGDPQQVQFTAGADLTSGEVLQLDDGRAAVVAGLAGFDSGDTASAYVKGEFKLAKTSSINLLKGGRVYWDRSAGKANYKAGSGDFYVGVVAEDSLAAATTVKVALNVEPRYDVWLDGKASNCLWTEGATDGLGVTEATHAQPLTLAFDAVAEVAMAAIYLADASDKIPVADLGIFEFNIAVVDAGDDGALDINFGIANGTHATDADSIAEAVFFHIDGSALDLKAESDDGTTEVAATDTTKDIAEGTYYEFWIDARDPTDIQIYVDGVNYLPASVFKLNAATGPLMPIVHLEKTSNDTTADVRVKRITARMRD